MLEGLRSFPEDGLCSWILEYKIMALRSKIYLLGDKIYHLGLWPFTEGFVLIHGDTNLRKEPPLLSKS